MPILITEPPETLLITFPVLFCDHEE